MDPPSPSKLGMSPPWKPFALSPERAAGSIPPYGGEPFPQSPSAPLLSSTMIPPLSPTRSPSRSPTRSPIHRRTDSDVSVTGLAHMFETLEVKDPREAAQRYKRMVEMEKQKWIEKLNKHDKDHAASMERKNLHIEDLESQLAQAKTNLQVGISREQYEKEWKANKANVKKWEQVFKDREEQWKCDAIRAKTLEEHNRVLELKYRQHQKHARQMQTENLKVTNMVPTMQAKVQGLEKDLRRIRSDLEHKTKEAEQYKNQVYGLQVDLEGNAAQFSEELQALRDTLKSVEGERDALKTSLKEEEVIRIAAEGHIPLPIASADESDEFGSPVRSPRKQRNVQREDDDKENVAPKKAMVDFKLLEQELATERRLRERAQDQIDFMKMECQFQCCSCRIAENKGKAYVHDNTYTTEMQRIKMSMPVQTPPPSNHEDDRMEGILIKQEPSDEERPFTPVDDSSVIAHEADASHVTNDTVALRHSSEPEATLAYSPSTGTFRAVPSPVKASSSTYNSTSATSTGLSLSAVTETIVASSSSTLDAHDTNKFNDDELEVSRTRSAQKGNKAAAIDIHEDAIDDESEDDMDVQTPRREPFGSATLARYELHTTTTTVPIAFSPATPAFRPGRGPMTPSTVAHAALDTRTPVLGELSLNKLPFDREAALEAIRQRRGRARSMAAGQGTPMKQMVEGVKDRRDISAPVSRAQRSD